MLTFDFERRRWRSMPAFPLSPVERRQRATLVAVPRREPRELGDSSGPVEER